VLTQERIELIAQCFAELQFGDKTNALVKAGYKDSYARSGLGHKLYENIRVKEAIAKIKADLNRKTEVNIKIQRERVTKQYNRADEAGDTRTALTACDQLNKHIGFYDADKGSQAKPVQQLTLIQIQQLIQNTQGPEIPDSLGIAGSQDGHIRPTEATEGDNSTNGADSKG
jgi:hypothetical protein